jgi:glutamate N-acetyltransferase/amino-acid N-acetyltransferase
LSSCCLQRFRFTTSLLYTACVSCEFLTPRFPSHFLLLTAVSNVGRAVGLTTFVSTQPAFQQALCASGNMADLASKTQVRAK